MDESKAGPNAGGGCGALLSLGAVAFALSLLPAVLGPMAVPGLFPLAHGALCEEGERDGRVEIRTSQGRRRGTTNYHWDYYCTGPAGVARKVTGIGPVAVAWVVCGWGSVLLLSVAFAGHRGLARLARRGSLPAPEGEARS